MSEKRFKLGDLKIGAYREIIDTETGNEYECVFSCKIMNEQQATITALKEEKESWKSIACQDLSKWSIFSNEVSVLHETRDIERFLEKYYEYCADMVRK